MSESKALIAESIDRIFAANVERAAIEKFEEGEWPATLWRLVEESGFHRLLAEDPASGWEDAEPVLRAIGFHRAPLPLAETLVANWLLAKAGMAVEDGPVALLQCDEGLVLARDGDRVLVEGSARRVPWASRAKRLVIAGTIGRKPVLGVLSLEGNGAVSIEPGRNLAFEPRDDVTIARTALAECRPLESLDATPALTYGALARAATMAGAIESILAQSIQYANDRVQFGKPIGKFQAIQHMLAEVSSDSAAATAAVAGGCEAAGSKRARLAVAAAKLRCGEAAVRSARMTHQTHGAIGFTYEHTLHYATRRLWSWRNEFGTDAFWAAELGRAAIRRGADRFWADITAQAVPRP